MSVTLVLMWSDGYQLDKIRLGVLETVALALSIQEVTFSQIR